jgi:Tol biopolymer transport system component
VKVLDFGLAKALEPRVQSPEPKAQSLEPAPTITSPAMTQAGIILGTAAYMAPEQAKGRPVDRRADIWAFGCVLYEMLAGCRPFDGEDITDTIAAVVTKEPDWSRLPAATPPAIATLLRRCLEKNAQRRLPHVGVARLELEAPLSAVGSVPPPAPSSLEAPARTRPALPMLAATVAAMALGVAAGFWWASRSAPAPVERLSYRASLLLPAAHALTANAPSSRFALSPDGRWIAYVAVNGPDPQLWLRALDDPTARVVEGTQNAGMPFWSPDSRFVAVFARERLLKADVNGGPAALIAEDAAIRGQSLPGTWGPDVIVFGGKNAPGEGLWRVPVRGGRPEPLTTPDKSAGEDRHGFAQFLPDGRHFLYVAYNGVAPVATYVSTLDAPAERVRLMDGGSNTQVAEGALLYLRGSALVAQAFDAVTRRLSGEPVTLANRIVTNTTVPFGGSFSASRAGVVVYHSATPEGGLGLVRGDRLVWRARSGDEQVVVAEPAEYRSLSLAPDARRAVVSMLGEDPGGLARDPGIGRSDLWMVDLARGVRSRFTFTSGERNGVWDPTGRTVIFNSSRNRSRDTVSSQMPLDLYRKAGAGGGTEEEVAIDDRDKTPLSVSRDGRFLLFETRDGLWSRALDGSGTEASFATSTFDRDFGQFSPDGRWVAYASDESGRLQIYVRAFPAGDRVVQVSRDGGDLPRWSPDGRELYFFHAGKIVAASVASVAGTDALEVKSVTPLFDCRPPDGFRRLFYDVAPDGRFLMMSPISTPGPTPLTLLVNWRAPKSPN